MGEVLSRAYRPKTFGRMIGQKAVTEAIKKHYASGREPHAWMFVGPTGSGKTTIARIIALSLQCTHQEEFGSPCADCQANSSDFNIFEVNAADASGIEEIGKIIQGANHLPLPPSQRRVYVIDEAHMLSKSSQNLLLKPFEDSPETTVWIITTTDPNLIIRTLRGRCLTYPIKPLGPIGVKKLVLRAAKFAKIGMDLEPLLNQLGLVGVGSPRHILGALEKFAAGSSAEISVLEGEAAVNTLNVCRAVRAGDWSSVKKEMALADANDARVTRLALGGYLKTMLLESDGAKVAAASDGIVNLAQVSRTEDGLQVALTLAVLHKITQRFTK